MSMNTAPSMERWIGTREGSTMNAHRDVRTWLGKEAADHYWGMSSVKRDQSHIHGTPLASRHFLANSRCSKMLRNGRVQARADRSLNSEAGVEGRAVWWLNEQLQECMNQHLGLRGPMSRRWQRYHHLFAHTAQVPTLCQVAHWHLRTKRWTMRGLPDTQGFSTRS